jgi:predicted transcriptional regulator
MTKKETTKDGRNSEIRVRYVKPEVFKALEHIAHNYKQKTIPGTILALIEAFKPDQELIKALQTRNNELHQKLAYYVNREQEQREAIKAHIQQLARGQKEGEKILQKFIPKKRGAKKATGRQVRITQLS